MQLRHQHLPALCHRSNPEDYCLHCGNPHTLHQESAVYPCGNPPFSSSHPLILPPAEMSFLKDLHNTHPKALPHHHHALHPHRTPACQTSGFQTQMVNHSDSCHHTTSCTTPLHAGSGTPCPYTNHHDIHCKSFHDMASNTPRPTPTELPFPSRQGSGYNMGYQLSVRLPPNHHPLHTDIQ